MFALFSGLLGTAFSVLIRMELSGPGVQFIADNQLYNSIITAHALLMIFFMVEKNYIFNFKSFCFASPQSSCRQSYSSSSTSGEKEKTSLLASRGALACAADNDDSNNIKILGNNNNNDGNKNSNDPKYKYVKILVAEGNDASLVNDPFNNRDILLRVTKMQRGVYI